MTLRRWFVSRAARVCRLTSRRKPSCVAPCPRSSPGRSHRPGRSRNHRSWAASAGRDKLPGASRSRGIHVCHPASREVGMPGIISGASPGICFPPIVDVGAPPRRTLNSKWDAAGGCPPTPCCASGNHGRRLRATSKAVRATRECRLALTEWTPGCQCTPQLSLTGSAPLSRNGRRGALAGRMWSFPSAPQLSLTGSVALSRNGRRPALAGQTRHDGSAPKVSLNAVTSHAAGRMRSREKDM